MQARRTATVAAVALFVAGSALAQTQGTYSPPPRTVEDILEVLEQYKPDPTVAGRARLTASQEEPTSTDDKQLAQFYLARGLAARNTGRIDQTIQDLRKALEYARRVPGMGEVGIMTQVAQALAAAEDWGGNLLNAIQIRREILAKRTTSWNVRMGTYAALTGNYLAIGDIAAARQILIEAESMIVSARNSTSWSKNQHHYLASLEVTRGLLLAFDHKFAAAEAAYRRALQELDADVPRERNWIKKQGGDEANAYYHRKRQSYEGNLAGMLRAQGKRAEAEIIYRTVLVRSLQRVGRASSETASAMRGLAAFLVEQGRYHEAELLLEAALDSYQGAGATSVHSRSEVERALAAALVFQRKWVEADARFQRMRAVQNEDPELAKRLSVWDTNWGLALVKLGRPQEALPMFEGILAYWRKHWGDDDPEIAVRRGFLAIALAAVGQRERALSEFRKAVPVLMQDMYIGDSADAAGAIRTFRLTVVLEAYIALLADPHQDSKSQERLDAMAEAFRIADTARGSNVQRALSESAARASIGDAKLAVLARQEQDAQQRIGSLSTVVSRLLAAPPDQRLTKIIADMRTDIDSLRANRVKFKAEIEKRFPDYANLVDPKPATIEQARTALREGEALISIYVAEDKTYVWAIPKQGTPAFAVIPLGDKSIGQIVSTLRKALDVGDASIAKFPHFDTRSAYKLYSEVLAPVEAGWKDATSLLIVPHRALAQLPFGVLVTAPSEMATQSEVPFANYKTVPWLLRKAAITQLPSVNALVTLRALPSVSATRREFVGFGDPFFSTAQQAQAGNEGTLQLAARGVRLRNLAIEKVALPAPIQDPEVRTVPTRPARAVANSSTLAQLARLPDTAEEIRDIALTLKADMSKDVFLGAKANENTVKTMNLADRKVIAFATHGLVPGDLNGLDQPALALSAPEVTGGDGDGLLTMDEILALKLNADWVVLSACNTAAGEGAGSEAVSGLGRAFFYAGARALLVSNWPVETVSARLLTTDLFKRQAENPSLTRADALRQTMLALMDGAGQRDASGKMLFSYAHPMFWAPFSLVGDGGR